MRARGPFAFASVAALATLLASVIARPVAAQAHAATSDSTTSHVVVLGAAALGAATFNQATALPPEWRRTWAGYGARVADQVGFAVVEESTRALVRHAVGWRAVSEPCDGAQAGRALYARVWRASGCAVRTTFVVRDAQGARHLNAPLLVGVGAASAISLAWRPERANAAKGQAFVATRIGVVLAGTAASEAWRVLRGR